MSGDDSYHVSLRGRGAWVVVSALENSMRARAHAAARVEAHVGAHDLLQCYFRVHGWYLATHNQHPTARSLL